MEILLTAIYLYEIIGSTHVPAQAA
ncbi:MAG: hypothetical protein QOH89_1804, partial [Pseudonocardiales bacterium]|nr:hypothetical protein [Pseudonocardiales bacterium]